MRTAVLAHLLAASNSSSGISPSLIIFVLVIVGMFWFMSRAQRKSRQRAADLQSRLLPGQEVMTGSGIYGQVIDTEADRVRVEVAPGVVLTVAKQAIARVVEPAAPADAGGTTATPTGAPEADESRERTAAD